MNAAPNKPASSLHGDRHTGTTRKRTGMQRLRDTTLTLGMKAMDWVSVALRSLPQRIRYIPADLITIPLGYVWWSRLPVIRQNYATALRTSPGDPRVRSLARQSIRNYGRMAIDFLVARTSNVEELARNFEGHGVEYYQDAIRGGHGVIFVLPHLGSWDVAAILAQLYQCRLTIVTESDWGTQLVAGSREDQGVTLVPRDRSIRALFRALSRNEAVVLLSDLANVGVQTIEVPFFGKPSPFPDGPARLSVRTGAPIMVISCVRRTDFSYLMEGQAPLRADPVLSEEESVRRLTAEIAEGFARVIAAYPEHWYAYRPVWPER